MAVVLDRVQEHQNSQVNTFMRMLDIQQNMMIDFLCLIWGSPDGGTQIPIESRVTPNRSVKSRTYIYIRRLLVLVTAVLA